MSFFLPAGNEVVAEVYLVDEKRDFFGVVLKIGIKGDDNFSLALVEASLKGD